MSYPNLYHYDPSVILFVYRREKYQLTFYIFYPITLEGRRGTTCKFATITIHLVLFSAALVELAKSIPVHFLKFLPTSSFACLFFFFLSLCPVKLSLLHQKTLKHGQIIYLLLLDQGQECVIFSNGCLDLPANLHIGNMVPIQNIQ